MPNFTTAGIFSDNMVLKFLKPINVFGTGIDGTKITVELRSDTTVSASTIVKNGRWLVVIPPQPAQDGVEMMVTDGKDTLVFGNVAIGAVWLAGGQSNMEYELRNCDTGKDSLENDELLDIRYYYTQKKVIADETFFESEKQTRWEMFDREKAGCWSAIAYYFARHLAEELGITVGIIGCNWGGSSASAWMERKYCINETKIYFDEYDDAVANKTSEQLKKEYLDYLEYQNEWDKRCGEYYNTAENPTWEGCLERCGENKYPGPPSPLNPMSPGVLHESMIKRIAPYTMSGVLWYQGESDDHRPETYYTLLCQLISNWREDWQDKELFFVIGQLPMHKWAADEDKKNWCVIREAQAKAAENINHTSLAILTDCGEFNEIHPKHKMLPGYRFFLSAANGFYGNDFLYKDDTATANPKIFDIRWCINCVYLYVSSDGLEVRGASTRNDIHGFEIAEEDGEFVTAKASVSGSDKYGHNIIRVSGDDIEPGAVRYLWTNYTDDIPLFDRKNKIPLAPFRIYKPRYMG